MSAGSRSSRGFFSCGQAIQATTLTAPGRGLGPHQAVTCFGDLRAKRGRVSASPLASRSERSLEELSANIYDYREILCRALL
jgi:hypothetical protein